MRQHSDAEKDIGTMMLTGQVSDLVTFLAVVDAGSFVAGGKAVGVTRSAASKAVGRLENRLGVRLLHRSTRAISLTDEGRTFHDRARAVTEVLHDAEASVATSAGLPRGVLRITVPYTFGRRVILPLVGEFISTWPAVQVEISFTDRPVDLVKEGFDLALRIDASSRDSTLVSRKLANYERVLVASPDYVRRRGEPTALDDLINHEALLFFNRDQRQAWRLGTADSDPSNLQVTSRLRLDSGEALREAAIAGHGIALLPIFLVDEELKTGVLQRILPQATTDDVEVSALYPSRRLLEPRVRRFVDLVVVSLASA